ncbi:MAG: hypothetical protein SOX77_00160 [Candidatus Borkfalkiaceae bacterium]|nr:hypothetical protein [Christensenellaceae bacterium]
MKNTKRFSIVMLSVLCAISTALGVAVNNTKVNAAIDYDNYVKNSFGEDFVATDCSIVSPYAKTSQPLSKGKGYLNGYYAKMNSGNSVITTANPINIADNTTKDKIIEFLPQIAKPFGQWALFDLVISDAENPNIYVTLRFTDRDSLTGVTCWAKDTQATYKQASIGQDGKTYSSSAQFGFQLNTDVSNVDQKGLQQAITVYWDNNDKTIEVAPTKCSNFYVRKFNVAEKDMGIEGYTGETIFEGFPSGKANISLKGIRDGLDFDMYVISLDGKQMARPFGLEYSEGGAKPGETVTLPAITNGWSVKGKKALDVSEIAYEVKVTDPDGESVAVSAEKTFVAEKSGVYTATYFAEQDGTTYALDYAVKVQGPVYNDITKAFTAVNSNVSAHAKTAVASGAAYNGYHVQFLSGTSQGSNGSYIEYNKLINVNGLTADDVILEYLPLMEDTKELHRYELWLIDSENDNVYVKLTIEGRGDAKQWCCAIASANDEKGAYKPASYFSVKNAYTSSELYGYQIQSSVFNKDQVAPIRLSWDNETKSVYLAPKRADQSSTLVRDFRLSDSELGIEGYTGTETFGGFTSGKIKLRIVAQNVSKAPANVYILSAGSEKFARPHGVTPVSQAIVGLDYPVPAPTDVWDVAGNKAGDISGLSYTVKVVSPSGEDVVVENGKFTPAEAGEYELTYTSVQNGATYITTAKVEAILSADAPAIDLTVQNFDKTYYGKQNVEINASAASDIYLIDGAKPVIKVLASVNEGEATELEVGETHEFGYGDWLLTYIATDYVGRTKQETREFIIYRNRLILSNTVNDNISVNEGADVVIAETDVSLWDDEVSDDNFVNKQIEIKISEKGGEFVAYEAGKKLEVGEWTVRYTATYKTIEGGETYTASCERKITVSDVIPPVFGDSGNVEGVYPDVRYEEDVITYYVTVTGLTVKFSGFTASDEKTDGPVDLTDSITVKVKKNEGELETFNYDKQNGYSFVAEENTIYYVAMSVTDGTNEISKNFIIESKNVWINAAFDKQEYTAEVGAQFDFGGKVKVSSLVDGSAISGATVKYYLIENNIETEITEKYSFNQIGEYTVKATAEYDGQTRMTLATVKVADTEKPVIALPADAKNTAKQGEYVNVPKATLTDNGGNAGITLKIFVIDPDGTKNEIVSDTFYAEKEGVYTVVYEATDASENKAEKTFEITVSKKTDSDIGSGCGSQIGAQSAISGIAMLLLAAAAITFVKKSKKQN